MEQKREPNSRFIRRGFYLSALGFVGLLSFCSIENKQGIPYEAGSPMSYKMVLDLTTMRADVAGNNNGKLEVSEIEQVYKDVGVKYEGRGIECLSGEQLLKYLNKR